MKYYKLFDSPKNNERSLAREREKGTATLISVLVLALLSIFVALALSRVTTEAIIMNNDSLNARAYYAAQGSIELMSRNFNKLFSTTLSPSTADIQREVIDVTPANFGGKLDVSTPTNPSAKPAPYTSFEDYNFKQEVFVAGAPLTDQPIGGGEFAGLSAERSPYMMVTTATHTPTGTSVTLTRNFISNIIPIFQFGIFYDHELEFYSGTNFSFGGLVHTNSDIYLLGGTDEPLKETSFTDKVSAVGHIVHDVTRNGLGWEQFGGIKDNIKIYNDTLPVATPIPFDHQVSPAMEGSVQGGPDITGAGTDKPPGTLVENWDTTYAGRFGNNLKRLAKPLRLPINAGSANNNIEIIKWARPNDGYEVARMGRIADNVRPGLSSARYFNKPGIRITLADSRSKLPGCYDGAQPDLGRVVDASDPRPCGIRLDGAGNGWGGDSGSRDFPDDGSRGYEPLPLRNITYKAKRVNGYRLYSGPSYPAGLGGTPTLPDVYPNYNRQTWIKVDIVPQGGGAPQDITEEMLSLGLTHLEPTASGGFGLGDANAIIKLQRYEIKGNQLNASPTLIPTPRLRRVDKTTFLRHSNPTPVTADPVVPISELGLSAAKNYAVAWEGQVLAPRKATYKFRVRSEDGVRLWVNGTLLINDWTDDTNLTAARVHEPLSTIVLEQGQYYDIRMEAYNNTAATSDIKLTWERIAGATGPEEVIDSALLRTPENVKGGLRADYFSDPSDPAKAAARAKDLVKKPATFFDATRNLSFVPVNGGTTNGGHTTVVTNTNISASATNFPKPAKSEADGGAAVATAMVGATSYNVVPVPIEMFDSREGVFNMDFTEAELNAIYNGGKSVPWNGVMSMIDIDMANLNSTLR